MANNKTTYTLEIDAEITNLKRELGNAKKAFASLDGSNYAKGFDKKIEAMLSTLDKLQKKASQPIDSKATFASLEKGFGSVVVDAKNLLEELQKISALTTKEKITLLPEGEQKKLKDAIAAVQNYQKAVDKAERARIKNLEANKARKTALEEDLKASKANEASKKKAYKDATKKGSQYGDALAITQQAEAAKKAQKEIGELEKILKKYKKELEELKKVENKTPEQEQALEIARSNVASVSGKIGARKKVIKNGPTETQVTAAEKIVADQSPTIDALQKEMVAAGKETTNLTNKIETLNQKIEDNSEVIVTSQSDYKVLYEAAKKLGINLKGIGEDASPENVQLLTNRLFELVEKGIKPVEDATNGASPSLKAIGEEAEKAGGKAKIAEDSFASLVDNNNRISNLKQTIAQFVGWTGASKALSAALRNAFEATKELDKAMTEIAVVTDFEVGDMWDQMPEYTQRANELGISITSAYEASALFYQQGLDTNEMIELSNETLKMARIAGLDAAEATDRMTAALRGFNMELDQASAQKVADVYSELAAITASDVDEISKAMTKTASIASSAGMEFETTAAFLSQIIETTRESAETAGTAMKTVIARFQELKKDPSEIGEVEGEIVDANAIETALRSVGVSLRDAGGQFRELDDVFLELSSKWNTLDKNTQRYIATIAAGSRQQSRFIAMMQDYKRTQELVTAANNSAGASQRQYEKTLDSLDTKLAKLENAWTEFSTGLMNSDLVKAAVDFLTGLLNTLNKVTQGFESFTGSLSKVGTLIAIFQTAKTLVTAFFDEVIAEVYSGSAKAGEAIGKGVKDGLSGTKQQGSSLTVGKLTGSENIAKGYEQIKNAKVIKNSNRVDDIGAKAWNNKRNKLLEEQTKEMEEYNATIDETTTDVKKLAKIEKDRGKIQEEHQEQLNKLESERIYTTEEANKISEEGFKTICNGAQEAAQAITVVGVGIGAIGQYFTDAGLDEVGEFFSGFGQVITFLGAAITTIIPIVKLLGTQFTIEGGKIAFAGTAAQAAWWWVFLIVAAVAALAVGISAAMEAASPEKKLEEAQEAAGCAADAADDARESYENLAKAFDSLEDKYDALEELTRGTEAWNKAVQEINQSVLDLIAIYPELSKLVDSEAGVLTLDTNSAEVQDILDKAQARAMRANNTSILANLAVSYASLDNSRESLGEEASIGYHDDWGEWDIVKDETDQLAEALARGIIENTGSEYKITDTKEANKLGIDSRLLKYWYSQTGENSEKLREFGEEIVALSDKEREAFQAVATNAMQLADTLAMSEEQIGQASNIVDDATVAKYYKDKENELAGNYTDEGMSGPGVDAMVERDKAIEEYYGKGARVEGNKLIRRDANGKQIVEDITSEEIKAIIASVYATNEAARAIELTPQVIDKIATNTDIAAIEKAALDQEGGSLTYAEKEAILIEGTEAKLKTEWDALSEQEQKIFGTYEDYLDKILGAAKLADDAFDSAETSAQKFGFALDSFMTADMAKGFTEKLEEVAKLGGGEEAAKAVWSATNTLLKKTENEDGTFKYTNGSKELSEDELKQIQSRIDMTDWTNQEALLALQIDLEHQYGFSANAAETYVQALGQASFATSKLVATIKVFDDFWKATEKARQSLEKLTALQWEYNRALEKGVGNVGQTVADMIDEYQNQATYYKDAYNASNDRLSTLYARGGLDYKIDLRKFVSLGEYGINVNSIELQKAIDADDVSEEDANKWIKSLTEQYEISQDNFDKLRDTLDNLEKLEEESRDAYFEVRNMIKDTLTEELQKQIDIEQQTLDATKDANSQIINKLQEQIDEQRQRRENEETQQNITDMQSQAAYLGMDTSGANALEILELNEQIAQTEQDYQDSLIDQAIEDLSDANEKAYEQRERQIEIARAQLDAYVNSEEFQRSVTDHLNTLLGSGQQWAETPIGKQLIDSNVRGMSQEEKDTWFTNLRSQLDLANVWKNTKWDDEKRTILAAIQTISSSISTLPEVLTGNAADKKITNQATELESAGVNLGALGVTKDVAEDGTVSYGISEGSEGVAEFNMNKVYNEISEDSGYENSATYKTLKDYEAKGLSPILSRTAYYSENTDKILSGEAGSYSDYLESTLANANKETVSAFDSIKAQMVPADISEWQSWEDGSKNNHTFKLGIPGYKDPVWVHMSSTTASQETVDKINKALEDESANGNKHLAIVRTMWGNGRNYSDNLYARRTTSSSDWHLVQMADDIEGLEQLEYKAREYISHKPYPRSKYKYKTGGLADFTGPAWLDGTPSKPEYILNAVQTERFFSLVDILEGFDDKKTSTNNNNDISVDVDINIESIGSDYDVEQLANKIRSMLRDDAMYRNVNNINQVR